MLSSLKQFTSSWIAQLLLGLLVLSFAVWGVADIFNGFGSGAVATVGKSEVSVAQFQQRYDNYVASLQAQIRRPVTPQEALQVGIPSRVLGDLINEATLNDTARVMGLGMSNEALSQRITTDPNLLGPSGVYSEAALRQRVNQLRMTLDDFVVSQRASYLRRQIIEAFAAGLEVPEAYMRAINEFQGEERSFSYLLISASPIEKIADPTETQLTPYFAENGAGWRAPELRGVQYFVLSAEGLARPEDITDAEVRKRYDTQIGRFTTPELRTIDQIVFDSAQDAEAAAAELASGSTFEELAEQRNLSPSDTQYGKFNKSQLVDAEIAEAAFALESGGVSGVLNGRFGPVIVRISQIEPGSVEPFDGLQERLRIEIAADLAAGDIEDIQNSIEDARAGGSGLDEVSRRFGLELKSIAAVDISGNDDRGNPISGLPAPDLISSIFQSDMGIENDPLQPTLNTFVWYKVTSVTAPRDRPLAEVRDDVVLTWKKAQRAEMAQIQAGQISERLQGGETLSTVADELGLTVGTATAFNRASAPEGDLTAAAVAAAFEGPKGHIAVASASLPSARIVLIVDDVTTPGFFSGAPALDPAEQRLQQQISIELISLYVAEVKNDLDVRTNQAVLNQIFSSSATPAQQAPTRTPL
jgi:peptidyl-prolyl cis-trans isomerase D